ncbi:MAG: MOSC domain-containing protein [Candidatus Solibacter usitatus]|nr:MOSC domain-containing protein [Candidatus Solibacter usitatus]
MTGSVLQINISRGGVPKRPVAESLATPFGLEGDICGHPEIHGGPRQAVLLIASEAVAELIARGYPLFFGALGENFTTRGLDRRLLRAGQRFRIGGAVIELTKVRAPCSTLDVYGTTLGREIYDQAVKAGDFASPRWGMSGFYAAVIQAGPVKVDDPITLESELA